MYIVWFSALKSRVKAKAAKVSCQDQAANTTRCEAGRGSVGAFEAPVRSRLLTGRLVVEVGG